MTGHRELRADAQAIENLFDAADPFDGLDFGLPDPGDCAACEEAWINALDPPEPCDLPGCRAHPLGPDERVEPIPDIYLSKKNQERFLNYQIGLCAKRGFPMSLDEIKRRQQEIYAMPDDNGKDRGNKTLNGDTPAKDTDKMTDTDNVSDLGAARRERDGTGSREHPFRERSADMLKQVLDELGVEVRRNIRAHVIEFRDTTKEDAKWEAVSDGSTADLRERVFGRFWFKARTSPEAARLRFTRENWTDFLNALGYHREVDPFLVWLSDLPAWDQIPRIEFILSDLFGAPDDDLTRWASRGPLVGAVQRARFPGSKIDESPILVSTEQGLGKSTLASSLVPPEYKDDWFGDALDMSSSKKEQAECLAGCVIIEISELDGLRRAEIGAVKAFLSRTNDGGHRGAYAIAKEKKPRRCVIIGTSNDEQCLANDPSGNRRLVPIILRHGAHVEAAADKARQMWWAEAMVLQEGGDDGRLPRRLIPQQRARAELHRSRDEHLEDLVMSLPGHPMTIAQIHHQIDDKVKVPVSDQRLGAALRVQGWTKRKVRDGMKTRWDWLPPADTFTGE